MPADVDTDPADTGDLAGRIGQAVDDAAAGGGFSGVVHVAMGEATVFAGAYGLADRDAGVANTVDTRFGIASATKFVTALGIGVLIDGGTLALGTRLVDVVADPPPGLDPAVTIGQLLNHTSGVFDYLDEDIVGDVENVRLPVPLARLRRPRDYLPMLAGPQKFPPGTAFSYSNGGYVLLGLVIEQQTGSFHEHLDRHVLRPGGMHRSGFFRFDRLPPGTATGYLNDGVRTSADVLPVIGGPDGGLFATAGDLWRLWRSFLAGTIVSAPLVTAFGTASTRHRDDLSYGYGLWIRTTPGRPPVRFIEGCDAGVSARSTLHHPTTIVTVISNTTDGAWPVDRAVNHAVAPSTNPE